MTPQLDSFLNPTFQWFTGVIEDINDPNEMGRVKVRCYGYHTDNLDLLPTRDLPWATPMLPITSASMTGIGQSATGLLQGTWVVGFFRDGKCQDPIILGSIPSASSLPNFEKGFSDPSGAYPRRSFTDAAEVDTPRAARNDYVTSQPYINKDDLRVEKVPTAVPPKVTTISPDKEDSYYKRGEWENRKLDEIIGPIYPKNHVEETESGHIIEKDDTAGHERLSTYHTSGTYEEVVANGDKTVTVVGDEYKVTFKNKNMYVKGSVNLTVDGNMKTLVKGNYHLEVEGDKTEYIKGTRTSKIGQNELLEVDQEYNANVTENFSQRIGGNETRTLQGNLVSDTAGSSTSTIIGANVQTTMGIDSKTVIGDAVIMYPGKLTIASTGLMKIESEANIEMKASNIHLNKDS